MVMDKDAGRRWRRRIREVLDTQWDPIGVGGQSPDEYEAYAGRVAAMLRAGASDAELSGYLHWVETAHMGLPGDPVRMGKVVASLRGVGWMH